MEQRQQTGSQPRPDEDVRLELGAALEQLEQAMELEIQRQRLAALVVWFLFAWVFGTLTGEILWRCAW